MSRVGQLSIVHVLSSFGTGGAERVALELGSWQHAAGHQVAVFSLAPGPSGPLRYEFEARRIETLEVSKAPGFDLRLIGRLVKHLRRRRPAIVHTHNPQPLIYAGPAARLAGANAVVHTKHGVNPDRPRRVWLRRIAALLPHAFVAVSDATAKVARDNHELGSAKLAVISNGIDVSRFEPQPAIRQQLRAELGLGESSWVVGTVGRLTEPKNHQLLLRAVAPLLGPDSWLVIVGDGPLAERLSDLAVQLGVDDRVRMLGRREDVARILTAFDVFVLSSSTEGLPLVILEAMATELPVVATDVGGVGGVIESGRTGSLVPSEQAEQLTAALALLKEQPGEGAQLGKRARRVVLADYSLQRMAEQYDTLYRSLLT